VFKAYFILELYENEIKIFNKIKCFSDLPTLIFLPLKQETGLLFFFWPNDFQFERTLEIFCMLRCMPLLSDVNCRLKV
jgi:alkyl hydroperoxide reductase subunit AhpC